MTSGFLLALGRAAGIELQLAVSAWDAGFELAGAFSLGVKFYLEEGRGVGEPRKPGKAEAAPA